MIDEFAAALKWAQYELVEKEARLEALIKENHPNHKKYLKKDAEEIAIFKTICASLTRHAAPSPRQDLLDALDRICEHVGAPQYAATRQDLKDIQAIRDALSDNAEEGKS